MENKATDNTDKQESSNISQLTSSIWAIFDRFKNGNSKDQNSKSAEATKESGEISSSPEKEVKQELEKEIDVDIQPIATSALEIFKAAQKEDLRINNLNIMIAGKTGAGKSTLINAVFGEKFAETGSGEPTTEKTDKYSDNDGLTIYDTKGLEINDHDALDKIKKFISEQESKDPSEHIHLAWVCIAEGQRRIEDADKKLFEYFKEYNVPVMVVITKASQDKDEHGKKFSDTIKEAFSIKDNQCQRVRALAIKNDDGKISEVRGIEELMDKSLPLLELGNQNAYQRHDEYQRCNALKSKQEYDKRMKQEAIKEHALSLVTKYSTAARTTVSSPIPLSDIALLLPIQGAMIVHINSTYDIEMNTDGVTKTLAALLSVTATGFAVRYTIGSVLKFIPIMNIPIAMFNATVAAETTALMGKTYVTFLDDHYDSLDDILSKIDSKSLEPYKDKASKL